MPEILPIHRYIDPGLNYLLTKNYDLSIRLLPDGFSFAVFDTIKERLLSLEEFRFTAAQNLLSAFGFQPFIEWLDEIYEVRIILKEDFRQVKILLGGIKYTLMPVSLIANEDCRQYLAFNHPVSSDSFVKSDKLKTADAFLIHAVETPLQQWLEKNFSDALCFHNCTALLNAFYLGVKGGKGITRVLLNIQSDVIDLMVYRGDQLVYCNSFYYSASTDLLYYVLFVMEQLKIDTEETTVFLSGNIEHESEIFKLLESWIRNLRLVELPLNHRYYQLMNNNGLHRYFDLLNIATCE